MLGPPVRDRLHRADEHLSEKLDGPVAVGSSFGRERAGILGDQHRDHGRHLGDDALEHRGHLGVGRLAEQHPPGVSPLFDEPEEGVEARGQPPGTAVDPRDCSSDALEQLARAASSSSA